LAVIRRWAERWLGYDRLLVAYQKVKNDNEQLGRAHERLQNRHSHLADKHNNTVKRVELQRAEITKLHRLYARALINLEWERFLAEENASSSNPARCVKIRLMDHDQAWEIADLLSERFQQPLSAYYCEECPRNPITRSNWWHVTRKKRKRYT
jgi:hypothetical protein